MLPHDTEIVPLLQITVTSLQPTYTATYNSYDSSVFLSISLYGGDTSARDSLCAPGLLAVDVNSVTITGLHSRRNDTNQGSLLAGARPPRAPWSRDYYKMTSISTSAVTSPCQRRRKRGARWKIGCRGRLQAPACETKPQLPAIALIGESYVTRMNKRFEWENWRTGNAQKQHCFVAECFASLSCCCCCYFAELNEPVYDSKSTDPSPPVKPHLHDAAGCSTGCSTGLTTGCIV